MKLFPNKNHMKNINLDFMSSPRYSISKPKVPNLEVNGTFNLRRFNKLSDNTDNTKSLGEIKANLLTNTKHDLGKQQRWMNNRYSVDIQNQNEITLP